MDAEVRLAMLGGDPYLEDQVRRLAAAAGAVVVGPLETDVHARVEVGGPPGPEVGAGVGTGADVGGVPAPGAAAVPWVRVVGADRVTEASGAGGDGGRGVRRAARRADARRELAGTGDLVVLPRDAEVLLRFIGALACVTRAVTVAVVGARGGSGASTLAAATAREAVRAGLSGALVELDRAGGGIDLLLGIEHEPGPRWSDLRAERAGFPPRALSLALPGWNGVTVLSGDLRGGAPADGVVRADALRSLASAHDVVVVDAPRSVWWSDDDGEGEAVPADLHVVVAACDIRSAAAAAAMRRARPVADLRLVARLPGPGRLHPEELAELAGIPLALTLRSERGVAATAELGASPGDNPRGATARAAARLVRLVHADRA